MVFLDLSKAYNTVDRVRLMQTLEGYVSLPFLFGLLSTLCSHQKLLPQHNGYHRQTFLDTRVMTQGSLFSMTLFNFIVYNFIRTWLEMTVKY